MSLLTFPHGEMAGIESVEKCTSPAFPDSIPAAIRALLPKPNKYRHHLPKTGAKSACKVHLLKASDRSYCNLDRLTPTGKVFSFYEREDICIKCLLALEKKMKNER